MAKRHLAISARTILGVIAIVACVGVAFAVVRGHREDLPASARAEKHLVIYSATDKAEAAELLAAFHRAYPYVAIDYRSLTARDVYHQFRSETDAGHPSADVVINSAMDLQIKLVNDRYAQAYNSPERAHLPDWAVWKNEAYAISAEPIVIGYNAKLLPPELVPGTHDELASLLHTHAATFAGKVGSYDPERSPTGYLYITQDIQNDQDAWDLIAAVGRAKPKLFVSTSKMIGEVSAGRLLIAYNLIGSYAFERAARDPNFKVVVPGDYALMMSRVALIARNAAHPASAKLFLDFMLSREGQSLLAKHHMNPLRLDMSSQPGSLGNTNIRTVKVGPALMSAIDSLTFERFDRKWIDAVADDRQADTTS